MRSDGGARVPVVTGLQACAISCAFVSPCVERASSSICFTNIVTYCFAFERPVLITTIVGTINIVANSVSTYLSTTTSRRDTTSNIIADHVTIGIADLICSYRFTYNLSDVITISISYFIPTYYPSFHIFS